jgi:hypothetical protein
MSLFGKRKLKSPPDGGDQRAGKESLAMEVGKALILCQVVEKQLALCEHVIFRDPTLSVEKWLRDKERVTMIGPLIKRLKTRGILAQEFEKLLDDFREHRNVLVHDLIRLPNFEMRTDTGREVGAQWALQLSAEAYAIIEAIKPIAKEFGIKLGLEPSR